MINNDLNCVLTTNVIIDYDYNSIFYVNCFNDITVTYNKIYDLSNCFRYLNTKTLNITGLNFENVVEIWGMFDNAKVKNFVDFKNKIFNNEIDFREVFYGSDMGDSLNLSTWEISIKSIVASFWGSNFETIDLSNFTTSSLTYMSYAFYYARNLEYLKLLGWNTLNVSYHRCFELTSNLNKVEFETENNPAIKQELEDYFNFTCEDYICHKKLQTNFLSNNQNNTLTNNNLFKNTNFTGYYLNNSVNYLFGLSGKIYNITSNLVNDYIVNPFQRLLRMLR